MNAAVIRPQLRAVVVAAVLGVCAAGAAPAGARQSPGPIVDIHSAASLAPDGRSMTVTVLASCPVGWSVVEATVAVSQPQASGQGSFPLTCIGSIRSFSVNVSSAAGTFELGDAQATASVTIKRGRTERTEDAATVDVQPSVFAALADTARLESGGGAVLIDVTTACPVGANGLQSRVSVSQGQAYGGGSYLVVCDGQRHTVTVRVSAVQGTFQAGAARALTFADAEHDGIAFTGVDDRPIQIVS
jgi:hypothetical protein